MENTVARETQRSPEVTPGTYQIHFEPGVHVFPLADKVLRHPTSKELFDRFGAGDLTVHAWNPQVAERMRQYAPLAVGLDSIPGSDVLPADKDWFWLWLPGSPKEMTRRNEVYIVGGDLLHFQLFETSGNSSDDFNNWGSELEKLGWRNVEEYAKGILGTEVIGAHVVLPISMLLAYRLLSHKKKEEDQGIKNPSRRRFLKGAVATIGGLSLATLFGRLTPLIQSYSPTSKTEHVAQKITDITKPFTKSTWLDGRTALVIAKTIEAMDKLGLPQGSHGSIAMGFPHAYEAGRLLTDKNARMEAIRKYAQEFFNEVYPTIPADIVSEAIAVGEMHEAGEKLSGEEFLKRVEHLAADIKNNRSEEWQRSYMIDIILPYFTVTTVYKVKEPSSLHVANPKKAIKGLIEPIKQFSSEEVKEAVFPLGNPERFQVR